MKIEVIRDVLIHELVPVLDTFFMREFWIFFERSPMNGELLELLLSELENHVIHLRNL